MPISRKYNVYLMLKTKCSYLHRDYLTWLEIEYTLEKEKILYWRNFIISLEKSGLLQQVEFPITLNENIKMWKVK